MDDWDDRVDMRNALPEADEKSLFAGPGNVVLWIPGGGSRDWWIGPEEDVAPRGGAAASESSFEQWRAWFEESRGIGAPPREG